MGGRDEKREGGRKEGGLDADKTGLTSQPLARVSATVHLLLFQAGKCICKCTTHNAAVVPFGMRGA